MWVYVRGLLGVGAEEKSRKWTASEPDLQPLAKWPTDWMDWLPLLNNSNTLILYCYLWWLGSGSNPWLSSPQYQQRHLAKRFVYFVLSVSAGQKLVPSISISIFMQQQHLPGQANKPIRLHSNPAQALGFGIGFAI